jgi:hypothetical protein
LVADVNSIINNIYDDTEITNHSEDVKAELDKRIYDYISSKKIKLNEQGKQNISAYEDYIVIEYVNNVGISNTLVSTLKRAISSIRTIISKISNYPYIALVVIALLIIIINIKNLLSAINWIGIALLGSGGLLAVTTIWINNTFNLTNMIIFKKSATSLIIGIIQEVLYNFQDTAKLLAFCGIIAILSSCILNSIDIKKKNNS